MNTCRSRETELAWENSVVKVREDTGDLAQELVMSLMDAIDELKLAGAGT